MGWVGGERRDKGRVANPVRFLRLLRGYFIEKNTKVGNCRDIPAAAAAAAAPPKGKEVSNPLAAN